MNRKLVLVFVGVVAALGCFALSAAAQGRGYIEKRYTLYFRVNRVDIERGYMDNGRTIDAMVKDIQESLSAEGNVPGMLKIHAASSPEGSRALNERLAMQRGNNARKLLVSLFPQYAPKDIQVSSLTNDWSGVIQSIRLTPGLKYKDTLLAILTDPSIQDKNSAIKAIPQAYMEVRNGLFDKMRTASITISVVRTRSNVDEYVTQMPEPVAQLVPLEAPQVGEVSVQAVVEEPSPLPQLPPLVQEISDPFYMSVKTNLLYDAVLVPNLGVEFYLGNDWSITANWMHAWWRHEIKHKYWRIYGGDLGVRKWFGRAAAEKPLTGHHAGIYGQMLTYDFENGGRGYMGGEPGGTILDKANYVGGLEYGYALPIGKRLNLDFVIGVGYMGGKYHEYVPIDGHYVWQVTKKRSWFGPTKAEVSLVWLLGRGNVNKNKGGRR